MCIKINSRQTGSRNLMGPKNASHDMGYLYDACDQILDFCHQQLLRKMQRKISWTDRGKTVYPPPPSLILLWYMCYLTLHGISDLP